MAGRSFEEQLAEAVATIEALRAENEALRDQVAALKSLLGADSSTTSKPPSTDPVAARKKRAERRADARAAKRAQGKQPGAPGKSLERRRPDRRVEHEAAACSCWGADLSTAPVIGTEVRQVIDLPRVTPTVTDHIVYRRRCACGTVSAGAMPPEARAPVCWGPEVRAFALYLLDRQHLPVERTAELLGDVLGAPVSTGWLCNLQAEAAGNLAPFLTAIKTRLAAEPVICADETGTRVGTAKQWVHTVTTGLLTLLVVHPKRGVEAMADIGIFEHYNGTIVHDGLAAYDTYTTASHAQCGAHLLRHLDDVGQTPAFDPWTRQMAGILCAARDASAAAADNGLNSVPAPVAAKIIADYRATLERRPKATDRHEAAFLALGEGAARWLIEAAAVGARDIEARMAEAVGLAHIVGERRVDEALGLAAFAGRFAAGDLASILDARTDTPHRADPSASLQPGTSRWAALGAPTNTTPNGATPDGIMPASTTPTGAAPTGIPPTGATPDGTTPAGDTLGGVVPAGDGQAADPADGEGRS